MSVFGTPAVTLPLFDAQGADGLVDRDRKVPDKLMSERTRRANARKSKVRARVEHVLAEQKDRMGLFIRIIGIDQAEAAITLANMACNMK